VVLLILSYTKEKDAIIFTHPPAVSLYSFWFVAPEFQYVDIINYCCPDFSILIENWTLISVCVAISTRYGWAWARLGSTFDAVQWTLYELHLIYTDLMNLYRLHFNHII
jgi:hypothetical protein